MPTDKNEDAQKYFIKELTKYYVDFLETDFHKRKNPKRSIKHRNEDNLLIGLNTNKYPDFNTLVWKLINQGFNIGNNPILTLDERIRKLITNENNSNELLSKFHEKIEGLQSGEIKECPKCKELRNYDDFRDTKLLKGIGRFCRYCKGITDTINVKPIEQSYS